MRVVAAVATALLLAGCTMPADSTGRAAATATGTPSQSESSSSEAAEDTYTPPPSPDPQGTYTDSCDYLLGDFSAYTQRGYRFIADVQMKNTGNIGTVNRVTAKWFLSGGDQIKKTKTVKVEAGKRKRIGFVVPVGHDEIDRHQSLGYNQKSCTVKVAMIDTFGEVQE